DLVFTLTFSEALFDAQVETTQCVAQGSDVTERYEIAMSRHEIPDVECLYLVESLNPVLHETILQCRNDLSDEYVVRNQHLVVRQMNHQIIDRVRSSWNPKHHSHTVDEGLRLLSLGVGDLGGHRLCSRELASNIS